MLVIGKTHFELLVLRTYYWVGKIILKSNLEFQLIL